MSQLTVDVSEASIGFSRDGIPVAILPRTVVDAGGLTLFQNQNYQLMGTVGHQMYLEGVYAGLLIALGPPNPALVQMVASESSQPDPPTSDLDLYVDAHPHKFGPDGEFVNDAPKELQTIEPSEVGTVEDVLLEPGPLPTDPASHVSFDIPSESASGELSPDVAEISQNPEEVSGEVARTEPAKSDPSTAAEAPAKP